MKIESEYAREYDFFLKCLDYHKITYHTYPMGSIITFEDLGIRHALQFSSQAMHSIRNFLASNLREHTLCYFTDELSCHYIAFLLPGSAPPRAFVIGPYVTAREKDQIEYMLEHQFSNTTWIPILRKYYFQICMLTNEDTLNALTHTLAESMWGKNAFSVARFEHGIPEVLDILIQPYDSQHHMNLFSNLELTESLYNCENELIDAVSQGQTSRARSIFSNMPFNSLKYETEPLRNIKNFSIITNTLLRKAAEQGGVHPIYIEQLSSIYLSRIENMIRSDNVFDLWADMIQKYCSLVNNHNTRSYSLPIQKVITRINFDITSDLSLNTMAKVLDMNASYLSNLFKKETGYTLTNYVNKKRMEHAAFLLANTTLPISSIAQHCGILDDNYFTKLFKRRYQVTPTQFRERIGEGSQMI